MNPRTVAAALVLGFLASAIGPGLAQPARVPVIAFLGMDSHMQAVRTASFVDGLRQLGYVDGKNIRIEYRWAEGRFDRLPQLAAELVALKPDVIVTAAPPAVRAAQGATATIPIVMSAHDPVGMGFVASLARPGGNITGLAFQDQELSTKRLDLLRQAIPGLTRVALLWNKEGGGVASVEVVAAAARGLGMQVLALEVREPGDFATAVAAAKAWGAQGMVQLASPFITKNRKLLIEQLNANRIPANCEMRDYVVDGCFMTYSASIDELFRRLAHFVDLVLKGGNPANIAIEQPREFEFVINLATAKALGLNVTPALRRQADEVIGAN